MASLDEEDETPCLRFEPENVNTFGLEWEWKWALDEISEKLQPMIKRFNEPEMRFTPENSELSVLPFETVNQKCRTDSFSHDFIQEFHALLLKDLNGASNNALNGRYKACDNRIVNSFGKIVFEPPSHTETKKYMDELIHFLNSRNDCVNPLVKAAIAHAQFESIHPFEDGNGRVGRALVSLYLYKSGLVHRPYFYLSEAISQDRIVYYGKLDSSRKSDYNEWINFFLRKIAAQARRQINYINVLDNLYEKTRTIVSDSVNSPKFDAIMETFSSSRF